MEKLLGRIYGTSGIKITLDHKGNSAKCSDLILSIRFVCLVLEWSAVFILLNQILHEKYHHRSYEAIF